MTKQSEPVVERLDEAVDHTRGSAGSVILEYGDYECPYSRRAYRAIQQLERRLEGRIRFAFRHFPLTEIHPHALTAACAAEAAAAQGRFWEMHDMLFHRQRALADADLRRYALELDLDLEQFESDLVGEAGLSRVLRDVRSADASGEVRGTPTLFIDGLVHVGGYDVESLHRTLEQGHPAQPD